VVVLVEVVATLVVMAVTHTVSLVNLVQDQVVVEVQVARQHLQVVAEPAVA
jgi:hypothetical protein